MKKVFRSIAGCAAVAAAASAPLAARADSTWELVSLMPFPISAGQASAWQESSFESLYQAGGGFAAEGRVDEQPAATEPTQGAAAFEVSPERGLEIVRQLGERLPGYAVPRYVRELPNRPMKTKILQEKLDSFND